jgi:hypothetical protein
MSETALHNFIAAGVSEAAITAAEQISATGTGALRSIRTSNPLALSVPAFHRPHFCWHVTQFAVVLPLQFHRDANARSQRSPLTLI